jgi:hypothetical protein
MQGEGPPQTDSTAANQREVAESHAGEEGEDGPV